MIHDVVMAVVLKICSIFIFIFTAQLAGKARQLSCPKIVLDHMCMYYIIIYMFVHFGFPQHWLHMMPLTTHLCRGLTRTEN